jgi:hypothetical protein
MNKQIFFILGLFFSIHLFAQTGIGTTTPHASAKLEVNSNNKGFLPPRVILTSVSSASPITLPAEGLLVYNLGSVGLQAGYYYWNGASWATIATASSAGNGVASSDLVKLYGEAYSTVSGKIAHTNGYSFTVPVSGRYLFDFASSGYANSADFTMTFKVRQGTTDVGTDAQTSASNTVHVEYNGKVEVNLQAGTTYNVIVISTGIRNSSDFDRVYYKQVAGNLPVTGQTVDYVSAGSINLTGVGGSQDLIFSTNFGGNIPYNSTTGVFTLTANKTYLFQAQVRVNTASASGNYIEYGFVDAISNALLVNGTETITSSTTSTAGYGSNPVINFIYTPISNQTVKLRTTSGTRGTQSVVSGTANITQIGSSAIINPWTLSGTNTYNSTGNVGIGTNAPTSKLNIAGGGVRIASGLGNSSTRPSVNTGTIGNYEIRGVGGGASQVDGQDDGFLRLSAGGGTTAIQQTSIDLSGYSATVPDMNSNIVMRTSGVERLRIDASGNVNVTGKINVGDPTGNVITKASGLVNTGSFVTLDNVKVGPTRTGAGGGFAGLSVGAVSTSFVADISGVFSNNAVGGTTATNITYTTTASSSFNGWGFNQGNQSTYILNDTTNSRVYRITLMIGASYNNNFISIERLL